MGNGLEQLDEFGEAVVGDAALLTEVMVVGGDELVEGHAALRTVLHEVDHLQRELFSPLYLLRCLVCEIG